MIAAWMLWSTGVGLLLLIAALAAEGLVDGHRRWVWGAAGLGTVVLTAARVFTSGGVGMAETPGETVVAEALPPAGTNAAAGSDAATGIVARTSSPEVFPVTIPRGSVLHTLDGILLTAWLSLSAGLALWALIGACRLHYRRRSWEPGVLLGEPVLWSRDMGPAIVGLLRPRVVLPSWVGEVEPSGQKLILAHEEEHRRARDGFLRFAMASLLIAFPWNPFLWLQYRRLCVAIELDCDRRVMRNFPNRRWLYGDLLVRFGARGSMGFGLGLTTFAERRSFLEKRIGRLLSHAPEAGMAKVAFLAFAVLLVVGVALWLPGLAEEAEVTEEAGVREVVSIEMAVPMISLPPVDEPLAIEMAVPMTSLPPVDEPLAVVEFESGVPLPPVPSGDIPLPAVALPIVPFLHGDEVPPVPSDAGVMLGPQFVEHTVPPRLAVPWSIQRTLVAEYPADLRDAGIGGTVVAYLFVNTDGRVSRIVRKTSSGHWALDRLAFRLAELARFLPGTHDGTPVGMWIEIEVPFKP